ncbi:MAG: MCP four helix bundle domain-containing protein [Asticcacaulis sp.]|nr:MCP four helix bundle domain-containing protein [Asticcacaulis sp.]
MAADYVGKTIMKLRNLKIGAKLLLLIGLMSLVTATVAGVGITRIAALNVGLQDVGKDDGMSLLGAQMNQNLIMMTRSEFRVASDPSAETIASAKDIAKTNRKQFDERFDKIMAGATTQSEKAQLQTIGQAYRTYTDSLDQTYAAVEQVAGQVTLSDAQKKIHMLVESDRKTADPLLADIRTYVAHLDAQSQKTNTGATMAGKAAIAVMLVVALGGIGMGFVIGIIFARLQLVRPITQLTTAMEAVARGADNIDVPGSDRGDEIGAMSRAFGDNAERVAKLAERQREQEVLAVQGPPRKRRPNPSRCRRRRMRPAPMLHR